MSQQHHTHVIHRREQPRNGVVVVGKVAAVLATSYEVENAWRVKSGVRKD